MILYERIVGSNRIFYLTQDLTASRVEIGGKLSIKGRTYTVKDLDSYISFSGKKVYGLELKEQSAFKCPCEADIL